MAENKQKSKYAASQMDSTILVEFRSILTSFKEEKKVQEDGKSNPYLAHLVKYLSVRQNIPQLTQLFSFASTINNHTDVIGCANAFTDLIYITDDIVELHQFVKPLIEDLISSSQMKVFYRCLNIHRGNITNPILRLMTAIVSFDSGSFVDSFLEVFDISLKSLPHLLIPLAAEKVNVDLARSGKQSVRKWMVKFWVKLNSNASSITRNDLLNNNKKIMSHFFKYMPTYDSEETVESILKFCDEKIIMELAYRKATKGKILNEWALSKIAEIFTRNEDGLNDQVKQFLEKVTCDEQYGISFSDNRTLFLTPPAVSTDNGAVIATGEKSFRISNKLSYILLTHLTPWSDPAQLDLVVKILDHMPELINPYMYHNFFNHGAHEPRLTSFYVGQTLLLTKLALLPIPSAFQKQLNDFLSGLDSQIDNTANIAKYLTSEQLSNFVCPLMITRGVLTKGLNSDDGLIKFTTAQLIIALIKKYKNLMDVLNLHDDKGSMLGFIRMELKEIFLQRIPEGSTIVGVVNSVIGQQEENVDKILLIALLKLVGKYNNVLDINLPVNINNFGKLIGIDLGETVECNNSNSGDSLSETDMLLLNTYLELISVTSMQDSKNKWYNVNKGSSNSLFTIIAKLPFNLKDSDGSVNADLLNKVVKVLQLFIQDRLIFQESTEILESQCWALVLSITRFFKAKNNQSVIDAISKIIDESIARCVKTPYKYIDMSKELTEGKVSSYVFSLCEQSKFSPTEYHEDVLSFINVFIYYMNIIGEPLDEMIKVVNKYWPEYQQSGSNSDLWRTQKDSSSFFEMTILAPIDTLRTYLTSSSAVCKSDIDSIGLIYRLNKIVHSNEKKCSLDKIETIIIDIISLWGNYAMHKYNSTIASYGNNNMRDILDSRYWKSLMFAEEDINEDIINKKYFIMGLLNEVFLNLWSFDKSSSTIEKAKRFISLKDFVVKSLRDVNTNTEHKIVSKLSEFVWVLPNDTILDFLANPDLHNSILDRLLKLVPERNLIVTADLFLSLVLRSAAFESLEILIANVKFTDESIIKISELGSHYDILNSIVKENPSLATRVVELVKPNVESIIEITAGFELIYTLSTHDVSLEPLVITKSTKMLETCMESTNTIKESILPFVQSLTISSLPEEKLISLVVPLMELDSFKNTANLVFSSEVSNMITAQANKLPDGLIQTWVHRCTLYITKFLAERTKLTSQFVKFIQSLQKLCSKGMFAKFVSKSMINSQIETILSSQWVQNVDIMEYLAGVVQYSTKNQLESHKHLSVLFSNSSIALYSAESQLKFQTCLIVYSLVKLLQKASPDHMLKIVKFYQGTVSSSDCLLKSTMVLLEESIGISWVQYVTQWDFTEDLINSGTSLVMDTPGVHNGLSVSLNKFTVENTVKYWLPFDDISPSGSTNWENYRLKHEYYADLRNGNSIYDLEFLLLLIANNDELFNIKQDENDSGLIVANLRALVDSGLLQCIVMGLSHQSSTIKEIALRLISACFKSNNHELEMIEKLKETKSKPNNTSLPNPDEVKLSQFKERSMFKVLLGNILFTFHSKQEVEPIVMNMWGYLVPILGNPAHFLYEKAYRFLLNGSKLKQFELPMYKSITEQSKDQYGSEEGESDYYKEMTWLLETITHSITQNGDLRVLKRSGVIEYCLNLIQSPFVKSSTMECTKKFLERLIYLENGADMLIRSYGFISTMEGQLTLAGMSIRMKGVDAENWQRLIGLSLVASSSGEDKRALEWTDHDFVQIAKRMKR